MCGFVGIRRLDGGQVDPRRLATIADLLAHRGPDGWGVWVDGGTGLAHRRLAIIDVDGSPQPMGSCDGRLRLVLNGEILNYRQLRRAADYPFATDGDTEVVLALHREKGIEAVHDLRGQFAYAMHDVVTEETWLVRDRLGILPLFYVLTPELLAFASEPKALVPLLREPEVDLDALDVYLRDRSVPAPGTLLRGVRKLPPGHIAHVDRRGVLSVRAYWSPTERRRGDDLSGVSDVEAVAAVDEAVRAAVADNLVADVPVGSFLSGGLDSSLVAALAAEQAGPGALHTFSATFGDPRLDESHHARTVSSALGTVHHEVTVGAEDFADDWRRLTWHRDAPLSEPADVAVNHLARAASDHVKVVLSGEGADEVFAGYPKHRMARVSEVQVPAAARAGLDVAQRRLPSRLRRTRIALRSLSGPTADERAEAWFAPFTPRERSALLGRPSGAAVVAGRGSPGRRGTPLERMLLGDCGSWLSDNLLERGDRMTMAASVELRPPLLDHRLVELGFALPDRMKLRHGTGKWILREVARPLLPAQVVDRPKAGFRVPLDDWFRTGLRDFAWDTLLSPSSFVGDVLDRREVHGLLERHDLGRSDEAIRIWTLLGLEIWHDVVVRVPSLLGRQGVGR